MAAKTSSKAPIDKDLIKARAREQVASRKLDRLKDRYDKLKTITDTQFERHSDEREKLDLRLQECLAENETLVARNNSLQDEAAMWKAQLFDQLDRLDDKHLEFQTLQAELAEAQWQMVELVNEERTMLETERAKSEVELDLLKKDLVAAKARVSGLKNLGTCLTAKLERVTAQRKVLQREHARLAEQAEAREQLLEAKDDEIEELKAQLFEARGQILGHKLESESWVVLKQGLAQESEVVEVETSPAELETTLEAAPQEFHVAHLIADALLPAPAPAEKRRPLKLAALPAPSSAGLLAPRQFLHRATKTVGGWFKLGSKA